MVAVTILIHLVLHHHRNSEQYCKKPRVYNSFSIQKPDEVICGHYCIYVLYKLSSGDDFYDVLDELYRYNH